MQSCDEVDESLRPATRRVIFGMGGSKLAEALESGRCLQSTLIASLLRYWRFFLEPEPDLSLEAYTPRCVNQ
jgi:hypothetical protein